MTVAELEDRMPNAELIEWNALDQIREDERERAERQQSQGMRPRGRF